MTAEVRTHALLDGRRYKIHYGARKRLTEQKKIQTVRPREIEHDIADNTSLTRFGRHPGFSIVDVDNKTQSSVQEAGHRRR